jgi:hypothetical protein
MIFNQSRRRFRPKPAVKIVSAILGLITMSVSAASAQIYVANFGGGKIGEYDVTTGAAINAALITTANGPYGVAISGSNLYVTNASAGTISEYSASTGAIVNASLVSGLNSPEDIAISGSNLYVANSATGKIGEYNVGTGAVVNASLVSGIGVVKGIAVSGSNLYVADAAAGAVGEYNRRSHKCFIYYRTEQSERYCSLWIESLYRGRQFRISWGI